MGMGVVLVPVPTVEPQTRTWVLVVSLRGDFKQEWGAGKRWQERSSSGTGHVTGYSCRERASLPPRTFCRLLPAPSLPYLPLARSPVPFPPLCSPHNKTSNPPKRGKAYGFVCFYNTLSASCMPCIKTHCFTVSFFFFLALPRSLQDLCSPTRD